VISFRYHLISVVAIFLALGLGVVVGTTALNGAVVGDLRRQVSDLKATNRDATAQVNQLQSSAGSANTLAQAYGPKIVAGKLAGTDVVLVAIATAPASLVAAVAGQIGSAGGRVTGQIQLAAALTDPTQAAAVRSLATGAHPNSLQLPATDDPGTIAGALLGWVLLGHGQPTDITQVLAGFTQLNLLKATGAVTPGKLLVLIAPGTAPAGDIPTRALASMTTEIASPAVGGPTIVVGDAASATGGGLVALLRGQKATLSTVDDVDTPIGQLTAVLTGAESIAGRTGQYGTAGGATALLPGGGS
jgi:hypothetical protein